MFYRSPLDSLLYLPARSPCVFRFPDFGSVIQRERETEEKKEEEKKKALFVPPFSFCYHKEQTHIKHTQGAETAIAVSAVLLWVAGNDNISHGFIYIIFFNHVKPESWSAGSWGIFLKRDLSFCPCDIL